MGTDDGRRWVRRSRADQLTGGAGWIAIAFGAAHLVITPWDTRGVWSQVASEGWWNTFTLDKATTLEALQRSEALWISLGSFGAPMLVLGCHLVWSARRRRRVPGWLGGILIAWGLGLATVLPASPAWAVPVIGVLVALGDRARRRSTTGHRGAVAGVGVAR